jgi:tRNA dimethylallyltransferase
MPKQKIVVVHGPTASGKSSIALKLAKKFNGFLISADSRQVYKFMDIGTNKDNGAWKGDTYFVQGVPEYMVDVVQPNQEFSVDDWVKGAKKAIKQNPDKLPIIVGGTGFYIEGLIYDFKMPGKPDPKLRKKIQKQLDEKGISFVLNQIKKIDPEIETKIDIKNPRRVLRAAEICITSGKPFAQQKGIARFDALQLALDVPRETLYSKINKRAQEMVYEGLVQEVESLIEKGYDCKSSAMSGIGYRQICQFLNKEITGQQAVEMIQRDTRRYAKRQISWLKRDKTIQWVENLDEADKLVQQFIK